MSATACLRDLIRIGVLHGATELGSLRCKVEQSISGENGERRWQQHVEQIASFWKECRTDVLALDLPWEQVVLFQDSMPVCAHPELIVRDLAARGSANYQLLEELTGKGARLAGTESLDLLREEVSAAKSGRLTGALAEDLLARRDAFIAHTVDGALASGEIGLLFLGMAHDVRPYLPAGLRYWPSSDSYRNREPGNDA